MVEAGFRVVNVNDGSLAAQAAASRIGLHGYDRVAALIVGTGVGSGVANRDQSNRGVYRIDDSSPFEIGHVLRSSDPFNTFETTVSGPALERTYNADPRDMRADHPAWREVGASVGQMATMLGVMNGVELVVPCGGVGAGASDKYGPHLQAMMDSYRAYGNGPQRLFSPEVVPVPQADCQVFEMFGAEGVMRDHSTRTA